MRVVAIGDDLDLLDAIETAIRFRWRDAQVYATADPGDGLRHLRVCDPELLLLDVTPPGRIDLELLREVRHVSDVPILLVTDSGDDEEQLRGYELGADGYIQKPFRALLLLARVRSILRRTQHRAPTEDAGTLRAGDLVVNPTDHEVYVRGSPIRLPPKGFDLVHYLMRNAGHVVSADALIRAVWGRCWATSASNLRVMVYRVRKRLDPDPGRYIGTAPGDGYYFLLPAVAGGEDP